MTIVVDPAFPVAGIVFAPYCQRKGDMMYVALLISILVAFVPLFPYVVHEKKRWIIVKSAANRPHTGPRAALVTVPV